MTADEFRAALKAASLRQKALADRLGVAPTTVYRWAAGDVPVPHYAIAYLALLKKTRQSRRP